MVDFDARKIPSLKHREPETLRMIGDAGLTKVVTAGDVMIGRTHRARIHHWLGLAGLSERRPIGHLRFAVGEVAHGRGGWLVR